MSTTDETASTTGPGGDTPSGPPPAWQKALKRYGPVVAVVVVVVAAVVAFGGGGGDDEGGDTASGGEEVASEDELTSTGPMTPAKADLLGETDVDFGPDCDTDLGTIKLVSVYAPPCVAPFTGDNGGATYRGVTADEVKVIWYRLDPKLDPLTAATVENAGADIDPQTAAETVEGFATLYNKLFETYGRTVTVEVYTGTGAGDDLEKAKADAIEIAEKDPFAVIGGPGQASSVFAGELVSKGIVCGPGCATALPEELVEEYEPYVWQILQTPDQGVAAASSVIATLAGPGKAELAGTPEMREKDRVYGLLHYDNANGEYQPVFEEFTRQLEENGIELATDVEFTLDLAASQENARTHIAKLMDAGVTTIIYYGDPLTPGALTKEATAQDYWPEWILGPNVLMDTTIFGRLTDQQQWKNGFGVSALAARTAMEDDGAFRIYNWAYGTMPPSNTANILEPQIRTIFTGIHLAGPDLDPETFRDGLFRFPPSGGGATQPLLSWGNHGLWPELDWGGTDDGTLIWWDPEAVGEDEVGNQGTGMYRYANGGERGKFGEGPTSLADSGLFDVASSVTVYDEVPEADRTPDYPPPS
ncbi:MAG TPA: hypothetical protein VFI47_12100 [Acidimicrobiales bacterium]|nr:hypothetical protein [Acidimicrobiales bacterium]